MRVHALELAGALAIEAGRAARPLFVAVVAAVLLLAGYRPAAPAAPAPAPAAPIARDWAGLSVRELRIIAREAGHRALARSGRRADLLAALGAA